MIGKVRYCRATPRRSEARRRWSQSGVRLPGLPAREEQRPSRRLPKSGCEQGGVGQVLLDQLAGFFRVEGEVGQAGGFVGIGKPEGDAVVGPDDVDVASRTDPAACWSGPLPTGRGPGRRTARAGQPASLRSRRGTVRPRGSGRWEGRRSLPALRSNRTTRLRAARSSRW